jgi:Cu/Zn superoxide dismutase
MTEKVLITILLLASVAGLAELGFADPKAAASQPQVARSEAALYPGLSQDVISLLYAVNVPLTTAQGRNIATATLHETQAGAEIDLSVNGLRPGVYTLILQQGPTCDPSHLRSASAKKGSGVTANKVGNFVVGDYGTAETWFVTKAIDLDEASAVNGETTLVIKMASDGLQVGNHAEKSDPAACGAVLANTSN